jgi:hypothetical protein
MFNNTFANALLRYGLKRSNSLCISVTYQQYLSISYLNFVCTWHLYVTFIVAGTKNNLLKYFTRNCSIIHVPTVQFHTFLFSVCTHTPHLLYMHHSDWC